MRNSMLFDQKAAPTKENWVVKFFLPDMNRQKDRELSILAAILIVFAVLILIGLPEGFSDVCVLGLAIMVGVLAFRHFSGMWKFMLLIGPFLALQGPLFGEQKAPISRVALLILCIPFLFQPKLGVIFRSMFRQKVFVYYLFFIIANLISGIVHLSADSSFRAVTFLEPLIFYVMAFYLTKRYQQGRNIIRVLVISGLIVTLFGLAEIFTHVPISDLFGAINKNYGQFYTTYSQQDRFAIGGRIVSVIGQPVYTAVFIGIWTILAIYYGYVLKKNTLIVALVGIVGAIVIFATGTRAALLSLGATFVALALFNIRFIKRFFGLITVGVILISLILIFVPNTLNYLKNSFDLTTAESTNYQGRIYLASTMMHIFQNNWILGYGPGLIQKYAAAGLSQFQGLEGAENHYASLLADGGIAAGIPYGLFLFALLKMAYKFYRQKANVQMRDTGIFLLCLFVFFFSISYTVYNVIGLSILQFMAIIGVFSAVESELPTGNKRSNRPLLSFSRK